MPPTLRMAPRIPPVVPPASKPATIEHAHRADEHDQGRRHGGRLELGGAPVEVDVFEAADARRVALDHPQRRGDAAGRERGPQHIDQGHEERVPGREAVGVPPPTGASVSACSTRPDAASMATVVAMSSSSALL